MYGETTILRKEATVLSEKVSEKERLDCWNTAGSVGSSASSIDRPLSILLILATQQQQLLQ
jgi:hypothetical protein